MNLLQSIKKIVLLFQRVYDKRFYRKLYVLLFIAFALSAFEIFSAFLLAPIFNLLSSNDIKSIFLYDYLLEYIGSYNSALIYSLMLFLIANIIKNVLTIVYLNISTKLRLQFTFLLRNKMFKNVLANFYELKKEVNHNVGELNNIIMWETHNINNSIVALLLFLNSAIILILLLLYLLIINFINTIIILIAVAMIVYINKYLSQKIGDYSKKVSNQWGILSGLFNEIVKNVKIVYTKNSFSYEVNRFSICNKLNNDVTKTRDNLSNITSPITDIFTIATMVITIYVVSGISKSIGESITYIYIIFRLMPYIKNINANKVLFVSSIGAIDNILNYTKEKDVNRDANLKDIKSVSNIRIEKLTFAYKKGRNILKNLNLEFHEGDIVEIIGKSGSGKSTFLDIILKIRDEYQGKILIDNIELKDISSESWYSKIGYVPQDSLLFDNTIEYNVAYPNPVNKTKVIECLKQASLVQYIDNLEYLIGENGSRLSGGQKQRVSIARALYNEPSILLFDEATSSLDKETEKHIVQTINALPKHLIILLVTHRELNIKYTQKINFESIQ